MSAAVEEERRKSEKPQCSEAEAREIAKALFGITNIESIKSLESYDDRNFRVVGRIPTTTANEGKESEACVRTFTLKVHNGVESDNAAVLDAQDKAMMFLHDKGVAVPYPARPTRSTDQLYVAGVGGKKVKRTLVVRLLAWVDGSTMADTGCDAKLLRKAGRFLGEVDTLLDEFDHEGAHRVW